MSVAALLNPLFLYINSRVNLFAGLPHGTYILRRSTADFLFSVWVITVYLLDKYLDLPCFYYGLGSLTNSLAVASQGYQFLQCLDLYLQIHKKPKAARFIRKYSNTLTFFVSCLTSGAVLNMYGMGKSNPVTCWFLSDEQVSV